MKKIFVTICLFFVSIYSNGQQQTPYEKKCYSLTVQLFKKLGVDESILNKSNKLSDLESLFAMSSIMQKLYTDQGIMILSAYSRELKEAEKLKTSVDFQREKDNKEQAEKKAKIEELEFEIKRARIAKEEAERRRTEELNNSDLYKIKAEVATEFNSWLKKGEFEKTDDYNIRMKEKCLEGFQKINNDIITRKIDKIKSEHIEFVLKEYNADKEMFIVAINFKNLKWTDYIKVPIKKAPEFKQNFLIDREKTIYRNWGINDNQLYPFQVVVTDFETKSNFEFILPLENFEELKISTKSLGFNNTNFDNLEFNFNDYQIKSQIIREKEPQPDLSDEYDKIFTVVQIPAEFPGGGSAWSRYLERSLNKKIPFEGAPPGRYTVVVAFTVSKTGAVSDIIAENDPGYGCKSEAIRIIRDGPSWKPAVQNGRNVVYRHRQTLTFVVSDN